MDDLQRESIVRAVISELQRQGYYGASQPQPSGNGNGRPRVPRKLSRIAIIGGGHGGHAISAHMALKGFSVNLFSFYEREIRAAREHGGVEVIGGVQGFGKLNVVTTSMEEAVGDAEMIMVVSPAVSHRSIASLITPLLKDGQIIVLNPGRMGGAIEFAHTLRRYALRARVYVAETNTLIYAAEIRAPGKVEILKEKNKMRVAAFPARDNDVVIPLLQQMYPQIEAAQNVLETSMNNVGMVFHPAPQLLNTPTIERVERGEKGLRWYKDMVTKPICDMVMEKIDKEKVAVTQCLGLDAWTALRWVKESYGVTGNSLYEVLSSNPHVAGFSAPSDFWGWNNILDEVPNNLVPMSSFGRALGIPTPAIDSIVNLACTMCNIDFWHEGRTVESLGLGGMTAQQMIQYVEQGSAESSCRNCEICICGSTSGATSQARATEGVV